MARSSLITRRGLGALAAGGLILPLSGCKDETWYGTDVSGALPDLNFDFTRAGDGASVSQADYRGQVVALFFGYTFCPDVCPTTLANMALVAQALGGKAGGFSVLFVTVDPERDTPETLKDYVAAFTDRAAGLYGTANQLASVTRRYRVTYRVAPHAPGADDYAVSHGKTVYIFDAKGDARLIWTSFDTADADIDAAAGDIRKLIGGA